MPRYIQPIAHKIDAVKRTNDVFTEEKIDFSALHLSPAVLNGLKNSGFERPSPIQLKAIPIGRIGLDLIAQAKSGTGKTCVFGVIVLEAMNIKVQKCQCVVVAPTREIAAQIQSVLSVLSCDIKNLKCALVIGGTNFNEDKESVAGAHIVIGTPGRLLHLIEDGVLDTECVRTLVLDEADKLVDESFYTQVKCLASQLPTSKQVLAMSATYHKDIDTKFNTLMRDPYYVRISADNLGLEGIHHFYYTVKTDKVKHQIFCNKISRLIEILSHVTFEQCLVFSNYQTGAEEISVCLTKEGFSNQLIAGNMAQRDRSQAMADFRECRFRVLISTDVTARGIDNEHVDLVINMDLPVNTLMNPDPHTYLHRAGRAGRFGRYGSAISIVASQKEHMFIQDLAEKYQVEVKEGPPYDQITDLLRRSKEPGSEPPNFQPASKTSPPPNQQPTQPAPATEASLPDSTKESSLSNSTDNKTPGSKGSSQDFLSEVTGSESDLPASLPEVASSNRSSKSAPTPDSVFNGWSGSTSEGVPVTDLNSLRSNVKVTQKSRGSSGGTETRKNKMSSSADKCEPDGKPELDGNTALSSLGSLGSKIPEALDSGLLPGSEDENVSVFNFSSQDVNHYQEDLSLFNEALGSLSLMPEEEVPSSTPSTCGSQKPPSDTDNNTGNEISRSRRGSKNQKKARKPPKSLNMASPKGQPNRRTQSAAAEFANSNILSPHTPKWRSEAVSSAGCIIHSKAINVKFLLENYLCLKYEFTDKNYENNYRGFFPTKTEILQNSSTALCEVPAKMSLTRFVSQGFVANSEHDPLVGKRSSPQQPPAPKPCYARMQSEDEANFLHKSYQPDMSCEDLPGNALNSVSSIGRPGCQSTSSSLDSASRHSYAHHCHHRHGEVPHFCREQSKDSGVSFYSSSYYYPSFCSAPASCGAPPACAAPPACGPPSSCAPPPCPTPGTPYYWWGYMPPPPMCGYPMQHPPPPPQFCSNCNSPQFNVADFSRHFSSADSTKQFGSVDSNSRHTPNIFNDPRCCAPGPGDATAAKDSWSSAWEKAWEQ